MHRVPTLQMNLKKVASCQVKRKHIMSFLKHYQFVLQTYQHMIDLYRVQTCSEAVVLKLESVNALLNFDKA